MAFHCPHCGFRSNEVQSGGAIAEKGVKIEIHVGPEDLNRQVVKSDTATLRIPELDFEIPAVTQRGQLNTIEGFLQQAAEALRGGQEDRRAIDPSTTAAIDRFLERLEGLAQGAEPFTFILTDPAGNSFIENPHAPGPDPKGKITWFVRTDADNEAVGLPPTSSQDSGNAQTTISDDFKFDSFDKSQVLIFPGNCSSCHSPCDTRMLSVNIPFFKEVIVMATNCDLCGYKNSEVKSGGAISPKGRIITLQVRSSEDLNRNILKSETAGVQIPELELEVTRGTLGGRFTTVEGLLDGMKDDLHTLHPFLGGDSGAEESKSKFQKFLEGLEDLKNGNVPFTLIVDDPVANSYVENPLAPDPDPQLTIEEYERTFEQNEELGLNDMKTEGYNPEAEAAAKAEEEGKGKE